MKSPKKTMWGGRFSDNPDAFMVEFGASITFDIELLEYDIRGSIAWAEALGRAGLLTSEEVRTIIDGLCTVEQNLREEYSRVNARKDLSLEDVHMTVESRLIGLIGVTGAKLHTGRSRNDQVAIDERLYLMAVLADIDDALKKVQSSILGQAEKHIDTFVPSYTHLQHAQPVRLAHYLLSWFWMLERDRGRCIDVRKRTDSMPLGSGAVAGSGFAIDRAFLAVRLGFSSITENSIDAISDRDYIIETLAAASLLMMHLSRIAEDLVLWSTVEFGFLMLPDKYATGSSMMPQKKNPDSLELIRGKTGRVYGALMTLLTVMKGLPLSYCKDMQEDKEPLFDAVRTVLGCLHMMEGIIGECSFLKDVMEAAFDSTVYATDVADYLTLKGMPFREAHEVTGKLVKWSIDNTIPLPDILLSRLKEFSSLFEDDIVSVFRLSASTDRRSLPGGTGKEALLAQLKKARAALQFMK